MNKTLAVPGSHLAYEIVGEGPLVTLPHPGPRLHLSTRMAP